MRIFEGFLGARLGFLDVHVHWVVGITVVSEEATPLNPKPYAPRTHIVRTADQAPVWGLGKFRVSWGA